MKRIIIPTDFSEGAWNALRYGMQLAQTIQADQVVVLNTYYEPHAGAATMRSLAQLMREESEKSMEILLTRMLDAGMEMDRVLTKVLHAPLVQALQGLNQAESNDLVVMGTLGETGAIEQLIGSNAAHVMARLSCPVLVIPPDANYSQNGRIRLAVNSAELPEEVDIDALRMIVDDHPEALIEVVQVGDLDEEIQQDALHEVLKPIPFETQMLTGEDVVGAIDRYTSLRPTDILVVFRIKRGLFQQLFHKSITKQLAMHTEVPLMVV